MSDSSWSAVKFVALFQIPISKSNTFTGHLHLTQLWTTNIGGLFLTHTAYGWPIKFTLFCKVYFSLVLNCFTFKKLNSRVPIQDCSQSVSVVNYVPSFRKICRFEFALSQQCSCVVVIGPPCIIVYTCRYDTDIRSWDGRDTDAWTTRWLGYIHQSGQWTVVNVGISRWVNQRSAL